MNNGFNNLWATPIFKGTIDNKELLDQVCTSIISTEQLDIPASDFQKYDILNDGPEIMQQFRQEIIYPAFKEYLKTFNVDLDNFKMHFRSWLGGCKAGYNIPIHNHSGASFSGVFYLLCDENQGGELILVDPRSNANRGYLDEFKGHFSNQIYSPRSGEFLLFPGFLYHHTVPFTGAMRLAMPVDLFLSK